MRMAVSAHRSPGSLTSWRFYHSLFPLCLQNVLDTSEQSFSLCLVTDEILDFFAQKPPPSKGLLRPKATNCALPSGPPRIQTPLTMGPHTCLSLCLSLVLPGFPGPASFLLFALSGCPHSSIMQKRLQLRLQLDAWLWLHFPLSSWHPFVCSCHNEEACPQFPFNSTSHKFGVPEDSE